jgi:hypothetical protein
MSCPTEAGVERNTARANSTYVPRAATATRLLNRVLDVYGYSGFRSDINNFLGPVFQRIGPEQGLDDTISCSVIYCYAIYRSETIRTRIEEG